MKSIYRVAVGLPISFLLASLAALAVHGAPDGADTLSDGAMSQQQIIQGRHAKRVLRDDAGRVLYYVEFDAEPAVRALASISLQARDGAKAVAAASKSAATRAYRDALEASQDAVLDELRRATGEVIQPATRHSLLLNGFSAYLSPAAISRLESMPGVMRVRPVHGRRLDTDRGPVFIGSPAVWTGADGAIATRGEGVIVGVIDTGIDPEHPSFLAEGDDGYRHENPLGSGVYLGDCAIEDYAHYCNDKLVGIVGYSEITAKYLPYAPPVALDYVGHGTHVASIAAGNELHDVPIHEWIEGEVSTVTLDRISGVAPHANIVSYQVCRPERDGDGREHGEAVCLPNYTVTSLEHAIEHGVSVINYSVGGGPYDPWEAMDSQAFLNAREAGIHAATSAGNAGPFPETIGGPGNSPWITSVAAGTHDRDLSDKTLGNFAGGSTAPPPTLSGAGWTTGHSGPIVRAGDINADNGECIEPFPAGSFTNDEIVVCARGSNARLDKGRNVRAGGAGGMVLINLPGNPYLQDLVDDTHVIPAIHLDTADGEALMTWLASGSGHVAEISASQHGGGSPDADLVAAFSSRGPNLPYAETPAIHVAAPGVDVYGAYAFDGFLNGYPEAPEIPYAFLSGTSMASPHVAGAYALIEARHPDWTAAEAQSAVMMTAEPGMRMVVPDDSGNPEVVPADLHAEGSGSLRVGRAARAGMLMDISKEEYLAANPLEDGVLRELNLPVLINLDCVIRCSWQRSFRATEAANWTVSFDNPDPSLRLDVDQPVFSTSAGDEVQIEFAAIDALSAGSGEFFDRVWITPDRPDLPALQLPVQVKFHAGSAPGHVRRTIGRNNGLVSIPGIQTTGVDELWVDAGGLALPVEYVGSIPEDPTPDVYYDDLQTSWHWVPVTVRSDARLLAARISRWQAPDLDLFVIFDADADGRADLVEFENEHSCSSGSPESDEACLLTNVIPGTYLVGVHNYTGSGAETDEHALEITLLDGRAYDNMDLHPTGPRAAGEVFALDVEYQLELQRGQRAFGYFALALSDRELDSFAEVVVELERGFGDVHLKPDRRFVTRGDELEVDLVVAANEGVYMRRYAAVAEIPSGFDVLQYDPALTVSGNRVMLDIEQPAGAEEQRFLLVLDTAGIRPPQDFEFIVDSTLEENGYSFPAEAARGNIVTVRKPLRTGGGGGALGLLLIASLLLGAACRLTRLGGDN